MAKIQSNSRYNEKGELKEWAWVPGRNENPADLTTKPVSPKDIGPDSMWQRGPEFLYREQSTWPIKTTFSRETLEGELKVVTVQVKFCELDNRLNGVLKRCSKLHTVLGVTARVWNMVREGQSKDQTAKTLRGRILLAVKQPSAEELKQANLYWVKRSRFLAITG